MQGEEGQPRRKGARRRLDGDGARRAAGWEQQGERLSGRAAKSSFIVVWKGGQKRRWKGSRQDNSPRERCSAAQC